MKIFSRIISLILCVVLLFSMNITGVQAASVKVSAPGNLKAVSTSDTVKLTWNKVSKANGYKIYKIVSGKAKLIKTINKVSTTKFTVKELTASESYKFSVRSYITKNGQTYLSSNKYVKISTKPMGDTPTPKATATKNSVTLKWDAVPGATGYTVHQYKDGKWTKIKSVTAKTYKISSLEVDKTYKFKIRPYAKTSAKTVPGKFSAVVSIKTVDKTKAKFSTYIVSDKSVVLAWNEVPNATGYRLKMLQNGAWVTIADDISDRSFYISDLQSATEYSFYVVGLKVANGKTTLFTKSDTLTIKTKESQVVTIKPEDNDSGSDNKDEIKPYRLEQYKKIIENEELYFEILCDYGAEERATVEVARKNGNLYMKVDISGLAMKISYIKKNDTMNAYLLGIKYEVPENEKAEMMSMITDMLALMQVNIDGEVKAEKTKFNGKSVVSESYTESKTGAVMTYYFDNDSLVGIKKQYSESESETVVVKAVNNVAYDLYFNKVAIPFL